MKLMKSLRHECIKIEEKLNTKDEVLKLISSIAKKSILLSNFSEAELLEGFKNREKLASTGIGNEIAIPHFASDKIEEFVIGMLVVKEGAEFDAIDNEKCKVIVFIIAPKGKRNEHIRNLSEISKVLKSKENLQSLLNCKLPIDIYDTLKKLTKVNDISIKKQNKYHQFQVMIQDEEKFEDILSIFGGLQESNVTVVEGKSGGELLQALPLFSNFWNENQVGFHRIILAVVDKCFSNEILRKINMHIEDMKDRKGIMVNVQEIFYFNGSLDF